MAGSRARQTVWTRRAGTLALCVLGVAGLAPGSAAAGPKPKTPRATATSTPTPTASPTPAPSPSATAAPEPSPTATSTLLWADEFSGAAGSSPDPRTWTPETGGHGWGNNELQTYTGRPSNVSLDGTGALRITARRETYTGTDGRTRDWTSARLFTKGLKEFQYGRVEARMKVPMGQGLWSAFWMLGFDNWTAGWPESGEIDVMETFNATTDVYTTVHGPSSTSPDGKYSIGTWTPAAVAYGATYHVYAVDWRPGSITFLVDDRVVKVVRPTDVPAGGRWVYDKPYYVLLNLAVGGWPGPPDTTTPNEASLLVDYVRVYR